MTEVINGFVIGVQSAWTLDAILFMIIGIILGLLVGAMPGLNPSTAIAVLLPITFGMDSLLALIMLVSIYYGGMYGGAITSIMINSPGCTTAVVTAIEGYEMTKQGRSLVAMRTAFISSFTGGLIGVVVLALVSKPLVTIALEFGPPEKVGLMAMGLLMVAFVGGKSIFKSLISSIVGLLIAVVGVDEISGLPRLTYGVTELMGGIPFIAAIMGLFAISEIFINIEQRLSTNEVTAKLEGKWPTREEVKKCAPTVARGTVLGFIVGVIPAAGPQVATWMSYGVEKAISKTKDIFGKGAIQGIAAAESANNSASAGSMVPLLTLGIPGSTATAVLLGGFMLHGVRVGPRLFVDYPEVAWGLISNMLLGQFITIAICLSLIPFFGLILKMRYSILYPLIMVIATVGAYSLTNSFYPVIVLYIFSIIGFIMRKVDIPAPPMLLGMVLGPMLETAFKQSLTISRGSYLIFIHRPISATLIGIIVAFIIGVLFFRLKKSTSEKGVDSNSKIEL